MQHGAGFRASMNATAADPGAITPGETVMAHQFSGSIVSEAGDVIYRRVSGTIYVNKGKVFLDWHGELSIESGESASMFEGLVVTDEGRRAQLFATNFTFGSNRIRFQGSGEPPFDYP
jgi:hypothetical protein